MVRRVSLFLVALAFVCAGLPFVSASAQESAEETWEADFFPVTVTYNGDLWGNRSTSSFEGNERFQVVARATAFTLQMFESDTVTEDTCLELYIESIEEIDGVANLAEADDLDVPTGIRGADDVLVGYEFQWPGRESTVPMLQYLSCQEIEEGSFLLIGIETRAGIYEEEIEIIEAILAGVEITG